MSHTNRKMTRKDRRQLIDHIVQADSTISELAESMGISLVELANWTAEQRTMAALEQLARLSDMRAQMALGKYRTNAVLQLLKIAIAEQPSELSRKACVDFLEADLRAFEKWQGHAAHESAPLPTRPPRMPSEYTIRRALEQLGAESAADQ